MMCRENFIFHFSCSFGLKSLSSNRQGSTTKFETFCVKFINKDIVFHFIIFSERFNFKNKQNNIFVITEYKDSQFIYNYLI
jgi:hypothetical protein